jgi:hypothetical protein
MKLIYSLLLFTFCHSIYANPFEVFTTKNGLINNHVNCIEKGTDFLWIGTNTGINRIVYVGGKPVKFSPRGTSVPVLSLEDDGKNVWVGLKGKGVYLMPKKNYKFIGFRKDILGDKTIIGIERKGDFLYIVTPHNKYTFNVTKKAYQTENIETSTNYNPVIKVGDKELQVYKGVLSRYNVATKSFRSFNLDIKPLVNTSFQNREVIGSEKGLVFYDANLDTIHFGDPEMMLSRFSINGEDTLTDNLDLNWDEYVFKYQFDFKELGEQKTVSLIYELTGDNTVFLDTVNAVDGIELKGLEHGEYVIKVSALNSKGISAVNSLNYKFSIANPLKDSIWLYIIVGFLAGVWTVAVMSFTASKYKKDVKVLEDALLEKTNKLNQIEKAQYGLVDDEEVKL